MASHPLTALPAAAPAHPAAAGERLPFVHHRPPPPPPPWPHDAPARTTKPSTQPVLLVVGAGLSAADAIVSWLFRADASDGTDAAAAADVNTEPEAIVHHLFRGPVSHGTPSRRTPPRVRCCSTLLQSALPRHFQNS